MRYDLNNKEHVEMIRKRCYAGTRRMRVGEEFEEFFQYVCLKFVENPNRKATIDQLLIDYLRLEWGHEERSPCRHRAMHNKNGINLSQSSDDDDRRPRMELETATWDQNHDYSYDMAANYLEGEDRAIFLLYFEWDLQLKEIGKCFGVSESRICQRLNAIKKYLKKTGLKKAMSV